MHLLFRADANQKIGAGHLMRCFALAQGWQAKGGKAIFITNCESDALRGRLKDQGFEVVEVKKSYPHLSDWQATEKVLEEFPHAWCVVDGYHFDAAYHSFIRKSGHQVLVVDDTAHLKFYDANAILNQNINAAELTYHCAPETRLLLGTKYAMLRQEFLKWQDWEREIPVTAQKILITMGGSDLCHQMLKAIRAVEKLKIEDLQVRAVAGLTNPHLAELEKAVEDSPVHIELIRNANHMAELMAWADVAISAAGSTCWEMAFMRLPPILMVTAENQHGIAGGLDNLGCAVNLGWYEQVTAENLAENLSEILPDKERREHMCQLAHGIVDGYGTARIIESLLSNS